MKKIRIAALIMAVVMMLSLISCGKKNSTFTTTTDNSSTAGTSDSIMGQNELNNAYADKEYGFQTEMPEDGEEVAVFHTNMGDIYIRLFPEGAPKTVENFKTHIKNGYYDGLIFHRVIKDFMIQGGDPKGNGTGGESIWGEPFEDEFCDKLINIRGSLAMANSGVDTNGSQFFINQASGNIKREDYDYELTKKNLESYYDQYVQYYGEQFTAQYPNVKEFIDANLAPNSKFVPDAVWDVYEDLGGNIHLDGAWRATGGHTVFGQVYEGMDIVDAIAAVEVDAESAKPVTDVVIKSAEIIKYKG